MSLPTRICESCGRGFFQSRGRPAKRCPDCRPGDWERYSTEHKKTRAKTIDDAYGRPCARCGRVMLPGEELALDHVTGGLADEYLGFSHMACNARAVRRNGRPVPSPVRRPVTVRKPGRRDPGPPREGLEHFPGDRCHCKERAETFGCWPSRCW